jgi:Sulfotransferase domain
MSDGEGRIPDFYLVGHGKSGTTALYEMLAHHPQVFVGAKEPRYFATEMRQGDIPRPLGNPSTLEQYKAWFAGAAPEQIVGDISPWYLWSHAAPALIAEAKPDARIIAILREPASFLHSLHRQWLQLYVESETDFSKALTLDGPRSEGREMPSSGYWPRAVIYREHVRYTEQLERYEALFGREQMLVMIYEDYRRDNAAALREILRFVGVDEDPAGAAIPLRQANPSVEVRSQRVNELLRRATTPSGPAARVLKRSLQTLTPVRMRQKAIQTARRKVVFGDLKPPDERVMRDLRRSLKGEVEALSEHMGRDLVSLWGYDALDLD